MQVLLEHFANRNIADNMERTPLDMAQMLHSHDDIIALLSNMTLGTGGRHPVSPVMFGSTPSAVAASRQMTFTPQSIPGQVFHAGHDVFSDMSGKHAAFNRSMSAGMMIPGGMADKHVVRCLPNMAPSMAPNSRSHSASGVPSSFSQRSFPQSACQPAIPTASMPQSTCPHPQTPVTTNMPTSSVGVSLSRVQPVCDAAPTMPSPPHGYSAPQTKTSHSQQQLLHYQLLRKQNLQLQQQLQQQQQQLKQQHHIQLQHHQQMLQQQQQALQQWSNTAAATAGAQSLEMINEEQQNEDLSLQILTDEEQALLSGDMTEPPPYVADHNLLDQLAASYQGPPTGQEVDVNDSTDLLTVQYPTPSTTERSPLSSDTGSSRCSPRRTHISQISFDPHTPDSEKSLGSVASQHSYGQSWSGASPQSQANSWPAGRSPPTGQSDIAQQSLPPSHQQRLTHLTLPSSTI